jgi:uncharacterized protein
MSLQQQVMDAMKVAMKARDSRTLEALRAVKAGLLLAQTESGSKTELSEEEELKLLQKLVKQRRDSAAIYISQGREDLAEPEIEQALVIEQFLPEQLDEEEVLKAVDAIIAETGASSMKEMGMVMGMANKKLAGKADGKMIATIVKERLS